MRATAERDRRKKNGSGTRRSPTRGEESRKTSADSRGQASPLKSNASTSERAELAQFRLGPGAESAATTAAVSMPADLGASGASSTACQRRSRDGVGLGQAALEAAQELALHCQIPVVSEAAAVVSILVKLVSDSRDNSSGGETRLRQCRSIVFMLEQAARVAGKVIVFMLQGRINGTRLC